MSLIGNVDTPASYVADYMQACVGMLGIPAGGFTADIEAFGATNEFNVESLYAAMLNSSIGRSIYSPGSSNATFAAKLVEKLGGSLLSDDAEAWALDWAETQLDNGMSRAALAMEAVEAISAVDTADENFGTLAQQFANRIEIANYYTFASTSPSSTVSTLTAVLSGVSDTTDVSDPAAYVDSITDPGVSTGQTYTLTSSIDTVAGTTGNDTIIGDAATLSTADQVTGGAGTDTLKMYGTAGAADIPSVTGVETIYLSGATASHNFSSISSVTSLEIDDADTAGVFTIGSGVTAVSIANQAAADTVELNLASTPTSANVTVNKVGTSAGNALLLLDGAALTTLNLTATGTASYVELKEGTAATTLANTLTTVNVSGSVAAKVDMDTSTAFTKIVTVNASANTGGVNAIMNDSADAAVTFTGGTGNDTANYGAFLTKTDVVAGGDGTDTLQITQASLTVVEGYSAADKLALNDNLSGLEKLKLTDAITSNLDASRFDSVNSFVFAAGINPAATSTISNVTSGVTVEINDAAGNATDILAVAITNATLAGNNSDTVNVVLNDAAAGGASDIGVLDAVGVDILNISTASTTSTGAAGTTTSYVLDVKATSTALDTVNVTGSVALDISVVPLVNSIATVDASGMTLAAATSSGLTVAIATGGSNGVAITGSGGIDTITGGDGADVINGGVGADIISGGKGDDVMTGGAGNDNFKFTDADSSITSTAFDTITDYTNTVTVGTTDTITGVTGAWVVGTTAVAGWTLNAGVLTKSGATLADFIAAAAAGDVAQETYAFVSGSDTYIYNNGANDDTSTADDTLIKLASFVGVSVVTADTATANEILIA